MKLKNTLSILFFLIVAVSCSMESDTVMNDTEKEMNVVLEANKEAYISLLINSDMASSTKAITEGDTDNKTDQEINNLAIFLLEGEKVIYNVFLANGEFSIVDNKLQLKEGKAFGILTKKKENLKLLTVANTSATILNHTTATAIKEATATLSDCTKFAETAITWGDYPGYEKINGEEGALAHPFQVSITLKQSYARVELTEFNVVKNTSVAKNVDVVLTKVELFNVNTSGCTDGIQKGPRLTDNTFDSSYSCNTGDEACQSKPGKNIITNKGIFFRTFAYDYSKVSDAAKMRIKLTYTVGKMTHTKEFVINRAEGGSKVEAGSIYRLQVTATLRAEQVDCEIIFSVQHWIDGGSLMDGEMTRQ